jgi:HEAT repeat protein
MDPRLEIIRLQKIGDLDGLIELLLHPDLDVRGRAALALTELGEKSVEPLIRVLERVSPEDWHWIAAILGQVGDKRAIPVLLEGLRSPEDSIRSSAARALSRIHSPVIVDAILSALKDPSGYVRSGAAMALGYLRNTRAIPFLADALGDPNRYVRVQAVWALKEIGGSEVREIIRRAEHDEDPVVQATARRSLEQLEQTEGRI